MTDEQFLDTINGTNVDGTPINKEEVLRGFRSTKVADYLDNIISAANSLQNVTAAMAGPSTPFEVTDIEPTLHNELEYMATQAEEAKALLATLA